MIGLCKQCGKTPQQVEFYSSVHRYCKEHWKDRVRVARRRRLEEVRAYDVARASDPARIAASAEITRRRRTDVPGRTTAHSAVARALRAGTLVRLPCQMCGTEEHVHAHHDDYEKPLEVMWLCPAHHKARHAFLDYLEK